MRTTTARSTARTAHPTRAVRTHRGAPGRARRGRTQERRPAAPQVAARPVTVTRLTRRGRLVLLVVLVGLLLTAFSLGRSGASVVASTSTAAPAPTVQVTVQPGDTLWTVAQRIAPGSDPRDVVQQLRRLNDLQSSGLQAGQQLLLPA